MKYLRIYILMLLIAIAAGCEKDEHPWDLKGREVKLFAKMGVHLAVQQETKGEITNTTNSVIPVGIVRIDEKDVNINYPYFTVKSNELPIVPLTANLEEPQEDEGYLRIVSGFKKGGADAPQFFKNSEDKIRYAAWYPSSGTFNSTTESSSITFDIPSSGDCDIMYSDIAEGSMDGGFNVLKFNHALSLFRIYAYSSTTKDWGNVTSLQLADMHSNCTIVLPRGITNNNCQISYSGSTQMQLDTTAAIAQGFESKVLLKKWMGAAPVSLGLNTLSINVTTANGFNDGTHNLSIARNFLPGYAYDIVLRFSDDGVVNAEVTVADWGDGDDIESDITTSGTFYDLSTTGTANCYIVSSANFGYCFNATIKGNGNSTALGGGIDATLSPKTVEIVWNEVGADFVLETDKIVEGKVLFRVNGNVTTDANTGKVDRSDKSLRSEGNVLLAVKDEGGNIIWTWHIWITDKPQKQNYTKGYIALDRNLGAVAPAPEGGSSEGMKGLFYQWGRPTPFRLITSGGSTKVLDATDSQTRVIPDVAVANPKIFYGSMHDHDGHNVHDWVDRINFQNINNLWGYREVEHIQPIKTLYDPCPVGYHVPYQRNWESLEQFWSGLESYNAAADKAAFWNGLNAIELVIEGNSIWYPFQGYINVNGVYKDGHIHKHDNGVYEHEDIRIVENWSSLVNRHLADDANLGSGVDQRINDSPYRLIFNRDYLAQLSEETEYSNRTRGLAVRCVSDNTADVVKDLSASQTANCYMVHENGFYKFKVTVRGNGVGSLLPLGGTTTAEINGGLSTTISPAKVDVLWWQGDFMNGTADFPQGTPPAAPANMCISLLDDGFVSSDGYVAFQVSNFSKGNAILAAYDNAGNILWTWHIWLTDKPADKKSGNYTKMDRFLGATYAPEIGSNAINWPGDGQNGCKEATLGFYYQWGRKDPIIGPPTIYSGNDNSSGSTVASSGWWKKNSDGTWTYRTNIDVKPSAYIPDVVKDPTAFYKSATDDSNRGQERQWFPPSFADGYTNVALWGYAVADYSLEGQAFSKTMHDPCPPGYRTPFHFSWRYSSSEKYAEGDLGDEWITLTSAETGYSTYSNGYYDGFVTNKTHFEKMWFPLAGYRDPVTGAYKDVGLVGYMNTGMPMGQYQTRSFWYLVQKQTWGIYAHSGQYAGHHGSAYGKMVRCMKD